MKLKYKFMLSIIVVIVLLGCVGSLSSCIVDDTHEKANDTSSETISFLPNVEHSIQSFYSMLVLTDLNNDVEEELNSQPIIEEYSPLVQNKTCIIAQYDDVIIHSPIRNTELTGVLFHQASYAYGLVMETNLPEINGELVTPEIGTRINREQVNGDEWLDAEALHLYRWQDNTQIDTSIDVGAHKGTVIYAPVDGTVVLVKDYMLYGYVPDIEIHIQPTGHPELDVVLLHQYDPSVKAGDVVEAGVTPVSHVRDIAADLTGIQLADYTLGDDPGNHSHIQINDVLYPGYYEEKLLVTNAFVTTDRHGIHDAVVTEVEERQRAEEQLRIEAEQSQHEELNQLVAEAENIVDEDGF